MLYREIKFRAWDKKEMKMKIDCRLSDLGIYYENVGLNNVFNNDDIIFLQYTGLKDKNGKEIYENDVVIVEDIYCVCIYKDGEFTFDKRGKEKEYFHISYSASSEIIGNIYENPDLLNK